MSFSIKKTSSQDIVLLMIYSSYIYFVS